VVSINADARVIDALEIMTSRGISSIAVVDSQKMLVGNISMVDVQFVTRSSSAHLLRSTCAHFLSVIKFEQGLRDGQDQVPVFAVYPTTTLAGTVAKLVATRAHRMWIVGNDIVPGTVSPPTSSTSNSASSTPSTPHLPTSTPHIAISPASTPLVATPPSLMMGKLQAVVSLTDILNLFARVEGLKPANPNEARMNRRRSSCTSITISTSTTTERRR
jgi:CBS domain-containing protein